MFEIRLRREITAKTHREPASRDLGEAGSYNDSGRGHGPGKARRKGPSAIPMTMSRTRAVAEKCFSRDIRLFAPLTFLWPRIIPAIVDGTAPADLTVTSLAKALPYSQTQQERAISRNA